MADASFLDLFPEVAPMCFVDVGAAAEEPSFFYGLAERNKASIIGFEPNPKACESLNAACRPGSEYHPHFLGRGGPATFYETHVGYTSSLYPPNHEVSARFSNLPDFLSVKASYPVQTRRLDDVIGNRTIDFLKLDVQGAELDVLLGAERTLETLLVAHIEVEFLALYVGQPLFADVDTHMRAKGFQLLNLSGQRHLFYTPVANAHHPLMGNSQLVWADAVYIPNLAQIEAFSKDRQLKLLTLLHDLYKAYDLCAHILTHMHGRGMTVPIERYRKALSINIR